MQLITGMSLSAYWISNYIFDILKAELVMCIVIGLTYLFGFSYNNLVIV